MLRSIGSSFLALGIFATAFGVTPALAGDQPNILIMGEDADKDTVPRHSRVFNRVLNALSSELDEEGFKVYDETAVGMDITNPARVRRTDAELLTVASRIKRPPIDVVVAFQIYATVAKNAYSDIYDLSVRIPGRMLHVGTGKHLGNFEVDFGARDLPPLPVKCNRDCILEHVGKQAKEIAHELGAVLAKKLDKISPARGRDSDQYTSKKRMDDDDDDGARKTVKSSSYRCTGLTTAFSLTFKGFKSREVSEIEEHIVAFKGFDHLRPVKSGSKIIEFWYESCTEIARLNRNLRQMLEFMGLDGQVSQRGNRFNITKIATPKRR